MQLVLKIDIEWTDRDFIRQTITPFTPLVIRLTDEPIVLVLTIGGILRNDLGSEGGHPPAAKLFTC
jgi:hypothetical protein